VAREFCWLAICQSRARTKGSHHRLDYFEHLKRDRTPLALIEQLAIQITGDIAMDYYRIIAMWADSTGAEAKTDKMRITHTWIRTHGTWQIIGGMSSPVNANGR
jgi:hypothetical protein